MGVRARFGIHWMNQHEAPTLRSSSEVPVAADLQNSSMTREHPRHLLVLRHDTRLLGRVHDVVPWDPQHRSQEAQEGRVVRVVRGVGTLLVLNLPLLLVVLRE